MPITSNSLSLYSPPELMTTLWLSNGDFLFPLFILLDRSIGILLLDRSCPSLSYLIIYVSIDLWISSLFNGLQSITMITYSDPQSFLELASRNACNLAGMVFLTAFTPFFEDFLTFRMG